VGKLGQIPVLVLSIVAVRGHAHCAKRVQQTCFVFIRIGWINVTRQMSKKSA
jgi:hypothetical protein